MNKIIITLFAASLLFVGGCKKPAETTEKPADTVTSAQSVKKDSFGKMPDGKEVYRYTLTNKNGVEMQVINYGGIITSLKVPDRNGNVQDVVLGFDSLNGYLQKPPYFGALIGRYGNRIGNGKFSLDGTAYKLAQNNNGQHLHGGDVGFDKVYWNIEETTAEGSPALKLTYLSKDGEEGYPGNLDIQVHYVLTDKNELQIFYTATTDKKTIINLTQHTYFNLTGNPAQDILGHVLSIAADKFVPVDKVLIPTGELKPVAGTPFDFQTPTAIGKRINDKDKQLELGLGYDHCWVLSSADTLKKAATLYDSASGRYMEVFTTEPAIQFYSGNFLDGTLTGKGGIVYKHRTGLCLETEHYPDSPNKKQFPTVVLNPGEIYKTKTIYTFSVK